jgi:AcrR family transcriptional regulator
VNTRRAYHSPLREEQTAATRSRIVEACIELIQDGRELTFGGVATAAGVQERTVYRHFKTKAALEAAVWEWIVENLTQADLAAASEDELVGAMRRSFTGFDAGAGLIQAMLHSPQGLAIRQSQQAARRAMFERCARSAVPGASDVTCTRLAAILQLLYSATAWEQLRSFWDTDVDTAADIVEAGIRLLLAGARENPPRPTTGGRSARTAAARGGSPQTTRIEEAGG